MALFLLVFSAINTIMYGVYFRRPATYIHTFIDPETGELTTAFANDEPSLYDYVSGV